MSLRAAPRVPSRSSARAPRSPAPLRAALRADQPARRARWRRSLRLLAQLRPAPRATAERRGGAREEGGGAPRGKGGGEGRRDEGGAALEGRRDGVRERWNGRWRGGGGGPAGEVRRDAGERGVRDGEEKARGREE
ncbi:hypothetical protein PAHAL_6G147500 [Panicum hallii]|uniref:Uncharacterized protein n=1 Tax=Panicum hallii TaxID=206008 RepID=A0A2T8IGB1_9POAL|nr:hypothetical protein PAHAL_6G147500 [Panicum hallii]